MLENKTSKVLKSVPNKKILDKSGFKAFPYLTQDLEEKKRRKCWLPAFCPSPTSSAFKEGPFSRFFKTKNYVVKSQECLVTTYPGHLDSKDTSTCKRLGGALNFPTQGHSKERSEGSNRDQTVSLHTTNPVPSKCTYLGFEF